METPTIAFLFNGSSNVSPEEKARVINELEQIGSMLTFKIHKTEDGWTAQCDQVSGIIAGGTNINPANSEIESQIRESIFAAFNVESKESPYFTFSEAKRDNLKVS
jgi:hypothetical protein